MIASVINAVAILLGGFIGTLFGNKISEKYTKGMMTCMAMIVAIIGIQGAIGTSSIMTLVICCVVGTMLGALLKLDEKINNCGDRVKVLLADTLIGKGSVGDAFVTSTLIMGVGSMAILGSIKAGLDKDYSIILTKSMMDFVSSIAFSAAMGSGVILSAIPIFIFQGAITLLASAVEPYLTQEVIVEMSAAGGLVFIGMAINMLELRKERIKLGDMLPAILIPIIYLPLTHFLSNLF